MKATVVETFDLPGGRRLEIEVDQDPMNPREWDNLGSMVCVSNCYHVGDRHSYPKSYDGYWSDLLRAIDGTEGPLIDCLPLFAGRSYSSPLSTSGGTQVGFMFVPLVRAVNNFLGSPMTDEMLMRVRRCLMAELEEYNQYLTGDVYGFMLYGPTCDKCGNDEVIEDSCWGFFGTDWAENGLFDHLSQEDREFLLRKNKAA